jgi:hypothetical protein
VPVFCAEAEPPCWAESASPLLPHGAHMFWSEHSERNCLSSVAAALGVEKSRRDYLGRWQPSQSDEYVRTAGQVVAAVQREVAAHLRLPEPAHCEADLLDDVASFLEKRSVAPLGVLEAMTALRCLDGRADLAEPLDDVEDEPVVAPPVLPMESDDEQPAPTARYWISVTRQRNFRRLHRLGGCRYYPGGVTHFESYNQLDGVDYDARCRLCWRTTSPPASASADDSDDSSSTAEDAEAASPREVAPPALGPLDALWAEHEAGLDHDASASSAAS